TSARPLSSALDAGDTATLTSGVAATEVVAEAELLEVFLSVSAPVTLALFVSVVPAAACVGVTVIVLTASAPLASVPTLQVTVPLLSTQPAEAVTKLTLAGKVSVIVTPLACPAHYCERSACKPDCSLPRRDRAHRSCSAIDRSTRTCPASQR